MPRFGLRIENDPRLSPQELRDLVTLAEECGYEVLWVPEGGGRDALSLLAALAVSTHRIKLATGILPIFSRTAMVTAMSAAGLANLSGGRFILGLGAGHRGPVENGHGVRFGRPLTRMRETVEIVRRLLSGERVTYEGKVFATRDADLGRAAPAATVPIYIAALGPRMLELSGELADGVLLNWTPSGRIRESADIVDVGASKGGKAPPHIDVAGYVRVAVTDEVERARDALRRQIAGYASNPFYGTFFEQSGFKDEMSRATEATRRGDREAAKNAISLEMQNEVAVVGSAEECRDQIERRRTLGLELPVIAPFATGDIDVKESYRRTIEAFSG